jgi:hypothetical protein
VFLTTTFFFFGQTGHGHGNFFFFSTKFSARRDGGCFLTMQQLKNVNIEMVNEVYKNKQ